MNKEQTRAISNSSKKPYASFVLSEL